MQMKQIQKNKKIYILTKFNNKKKYIKKITTKLNR